MSMRIRRIFFSLFVFSDRTGQLNLQQSEREFNFTSGLRHHKVLDMRGFLFVLGRVTLDYVWVQMEIKRTADKAFLYGAKAIIKRFTLDEPRQESINPRQMTALWRIKAELQRNEQFKGDKPVFLLLWNKQRF